MDKLNRRSFLGVIGSLAATVVAAAVAPAIQPIAQLAASMPVATAVPTVTADMFRAQAKAQLAEWYGNQLDLMLLKHMSGQEAVFDD